MLRAQQTVDKLKLEGDEKVGAEIVKRALEEPLRQIAENAGLEGSIVAEKIKNSKEYSFGYDAARDKFTDLISAGIIDPAKVTRCAIQNAASISALMLTTEALITDIPEEKKEMPMPPGGGYGGGMY